MTHPLDGKYRITSTTSYRGPIEKRSDGETQIIDGKTSRIDDAHCRWTSHFEIINDHEVKMISIADPSHCAIDFLLTAPDGSPTREITTYEAILKLSRKEDGQIQMSGKIHYGNDVVFLTMRKKLE